jgi:hypothetical protein
MHKNWTLQIENESSPSNNFTMRSSMIFLVDALTETLALWMWRRGQLRAACDGQVK